MRILLAVGTTAGGTGQHVHDLAAGLVAAGCEVNVAAPADELARFAVAATGAATTVLPVTDRPSRGDRKVVTILADLATGADVVHAHGARVGALAAVALTGSGIPLVTTLHNAAPPGRLTRFVHAGLERLVARRSALVLGVSTDLVDRQRALGARRAMRTVVAAPPPQPVSRDRQQVRIDLRLPPRTSLLVTVGRLAPQKDLPLLVTAVRAVAAAGESVLSVVAGEGPDRSALEALIEGTGAPVRLLGQRSDVPDLIAAADVVVSSARWEGQPVALQEALHAGAAIVATDAGGTADVVGEAAILVPVGDAETLSRALLDVIRHGSVRDDLQSKARERAGELPDVHAATMAALEAYRSVLSDPSGRAMT